MKFKHIVFDVDGTLIDSETAVLKSLQKTLQEEGIKKSLEELKFSLGIPGKDALLILRIDDLERVEEKWMKNLTIYADEITLFDGVKQVIQELKSKNFKLGIITSKTKEEYNTDFIKFDIHSYFDLVICADDTIKHKPDGEPMEKYIEITGASKEEIIEACKIANAHEFIKNLKNKYDTYINEGGDNLSIGQKQLISIARAILKNPDILILDEATSSIDTNTERKVQDAIKNIMKNRTSIIIAHRLSTIKYCDNIIVVDKGKIIESGSHKELMQNKGIYYDSILATIDKT